MKYVCCSLLFVFCYAVQTHSQIWGHYNKENNGLPSNKVNLIRIDSNNVKWIGSDIGLISLYKDTWKLHNSVSNLPVAKINDIDFEYSPSNSKLWIASDSGVSVAFYKTDSIYNASTYSTGNSILKTNKINAITIDTAHARYFSTDSGLYIFKDTLWHHISTNMLTDFSIVTSGSCKNDWWSYFGTKGGGVIRSHYDEVDGISGETLITKEWSGLNSQQINCIVMYGNDQLYATNDGFAYHHSYLSKESWYPVVSSLDLTPQNNTLVQLLPENIINCAVLDKNENYWLGTEKGLIRIKFTVKDTSVYQYTTNENLSGNNIKNLTTNMNGDIWIVTDAGIDFYDFSLNNINFNKNIRFTFSFYPNPVKAKLTLNYSSPAETLNMHIHDVSGILICSEVLTPGLNKSATLDLQTRGINAGIYFVVIENKKQRITKKLIVTN